MLLIRADVRLLLSYFPTFIQFRLMLVPMNFAILLRTYNNSQQKRLQNAIEYFRSCTGPAVLSTERWIVLYKYLSSDLYMLHIAKLNKCL